MSEAKGLWLLKQKGKDLWLRYQPSSLTGEILAHVDGWESPLGAPSAFLKPDVGLILFLSRRAGVELEPVPFIEVGPAPTSPLWGSVAP